MAQDPNPVEPTSPDAKACEQDKGLARGAEPSKSGSGLSTGVETGAIEPGNTQGASSAR